jgi:sporulation protein YlmC with PRC-barrel domain
MNAGEGGHFVSSDALVDTPVVNNDGDMLGHVADVMLDVDEGRVAYAVLAHGGVLGLGEQLSIVPWRSLRLDAAHDCFVLDATRESLAATFPTEARMDM